MGQAQDRRSAARALTEAGRFFFARGWVPATSGNFSARLSADEALLTVSGRHKGHLDPEADFLRVDLDGRSLDADRRPSAETELHTTLYRRDAGIGAVLHTHSPHATVLSQLTRGGDLELAEYEVLKAFPGIATHSASVRVPVFDNDQDITRLAAAVAARMDAAGLGVGYLIAGHGCYTWGETVADAVRHVEALEFLFECELLKRGLVR
ncbi:methylthioribulose 1-phosphate dehydratase [Ectothiorhodospiraceae bacterium 2226]|nr:methylthioribulose 1-phosphate dehydratase [Ectothiorhodospiraceae bacterium 2226]